MKIILPLEVIIPRKTKEDKVFPLNLNIYRNTHYMTLNEAKELMLYEVEKRLPGGSAGSPPYLFTYTIYPRTGRGFDLGNVCSIIQKFTDDALIHLGVIIDDNYKIVREINYRFGEIDKVNPRAELIISSMEKN
ncbi:MAG: hypothetical protein KKF30_07520 [Proteobacteria bacterium]|nr:hypothetical protein [Pseudomonadota bacterium]MBU4470283.1 hypothetical protein [Pseudomonadota bacterium]MCG2752696.1 hypothetical protein [Desulfobacteraceae bacterium]